MTAIPWLITITVQDEKGRKGYVRLNYASEATEAQATAFARELMLWLDACIGGQIVGAMLSRSLPLMWSAPTGFAASDVEGKALFALRTTGEFPYRHYWPAWNVYYTKVVPFTDKPARRPDDWMLPVQALKSLYTQARALDHPFNPCDSRGDELKYFTRETAFVWRKK